MPVSSLASYKVFFWSWGPEYGTHWRRCSSSDCCGPNLSLCSPLFSWLVVRAVPVPVEYAGVAGKGWPWRAWWGRWDWAAEWALGERNLVGGSGPASRLVTHLLEGRHLKRKEGQCFYSCSGCAVHIFQHLEEPFLHSQNLPPWREATILNWSHQWLITLVCECVCVCGFVFAHPRPRMYYVFTSLNTIYR